MSQDQKDSYIKYLEKVLINTIEGVCESVAEAHNVDIIFKPDLKSFFAYGKIVLKNFMAQFASVCLEIQSYNKKDKKEIVIELDKGLVKNSITIK